MFLIIFSPSAILTEQITMDKNQSLPELLSEEDINKINELSSKAPSYLKSYLELKCNEWRSTKVTIAILGESQRGKSSFINRVIGLKAGQPGAAPVNNRECTTEAETYKCRGNELITLVDLPGVNTNTFPRHDYMERFQFTRYLHYLLVLILSAKEKVSKSVVVLARSVLH